MKRTLHCWGLTLVWDGDIGARGHKAVAWKPALVVEKPTLVAGRRTEDGDRPCTVVCKSFR